MRRIDLSNITAEELNELIEKARKYDEMIEARRKGAERANNISAEARSERAKKAAAARWHK